MVKDDEKRFIDNVKISDAHTLHTHSLKSPVLKRNPKGTDMTGIQKIRNKDGTYSYRAQVRLTDGLPQQSKSFPTLVEARTWKAQEEVKRRQGLYFPSMTSKQNKLGQLIDRYIEKVLPSKPKNASNTRHQLLWWKGKLSNLPLNRLSSDVISNTRDLLLNEPNENGKKRSRKTANRYLAALSVALSYGVDECGWLNSNPAIKVTKFNEGSSRNRILNSKELEALLAACKQSKCKALFPVIFLAMRTGMRLGEILSLNWTDVGLNQNVVFLRDTKSGAPRSVPLSNDAKALLEELTSPLQREGLVFKGKRFKGRVTIHKPFYTALKLAGIKDVRIHDLRHLFCTTAATSGASILQIKSITGHKTLQMLARYTHIEGAHLKHIVDGVDKSLAKGEADDK